MVDVGDDGDVAEFFNKHGVNSDGATVVTQVFEGRIYRLYGLVRQLAGLQGMHTIEPFTQGGRSSIHRVEGSVAGLSPSMSVTDNDVSTAGQAPARRMVVVDDLAVARHRLFTRRLSL